MLINTSFYVYFLIFVKTFNRKRKKNIHIYNMVNLNKHYNPKNLSDRVALMFTKFLRFLADAFFKKKIWS